MSALHGHTPCVEFLLRKGFEVDRRNKSGQTATHAAALNGHVDCLSLLVSRGADLDARDCRGETPLHASQSDACARALLDRRANPLEKNNDGSTWLHVAAARGHVSAIRGVLQVLKKAAVAQQRDLQGRTALHVAAAPAAAAAAAAPSGRFAGDGSSLPRRHDRLHLVWQDDQLDCIRLLVEAGADVNARDNWGQTALHRASCFDQRESVRLLLQLGADPGRRDREGRHAAHLAAMHGNSDCFGLLSEAKADAAQVSGGGLLEVEGNEAESPYTSKPIQFISGRSDGMKRTRKRSRKESDSRV